MAITANLKPRTTSRAAFETFDTDLRADSKFEECELGALIEEGRQDMKTNNPMAWRVSFAAFVMQNEKVSQTRTALMVASIIALLACTAACGAMLAYPLGPAYLVSGSIVSSMN